MAVLSLNDRSRLVAESMLARADELGIIAHNISGATVLDCGSRAAGSLAAGILMARVCLADLGTVSLVPGVVAGVPLPRVVVDVQHPVPACMASQYAGWQVSVGDYFAMGSGPMRAMYAKEELFAEETFAKFKERPTCAVGVLETKVIPTPEVIAYLSDRVVLKPRHLILLTARTASMAGGVQVVARSVETALHKLHALKFDLTRIVAGFGSAPLPPAAKNDLAAIGRTNDAVLYGAQVTLFATGDDDSLKAAAEQLPSSASRDYGRPFGEIFKQYNHDFYKVDPMLFSPAQVSVQNLNTGNTFTFGKVNEEVLAHSFFG